MSEDDDLRARGEKLAKKLTAAHAERARDATSQARKPNPNAAAMSLAVRAASEIVAGVAVGAVFGWGIDGLFHTKPAFLIVFLLLGSAAGVWNVIRATTPKGGA
jgi:ATP synthase protein I